MSRRHKIAISISQDALSETERIAKRTGESRSAVFERAVHYLVAAERHRELSRQYVDAYRRQPERRAEIDAALGTALATLAGEPWDETG